MHNGAIANFSKVKRAILSSLSDPVFGIIEGMSLFVINYFSILILLGTTDSEAAFALFLNEINPTLDLHQLFGPEQIATALEKTVHKIVSFTESVNAGTLFFE